MKAFLFSILFTVFAAGPAFAVEVESAVSKDVLGEIAKAYHLSQFLKSKAGHGPMSSTKSVQVKSSGGDCDDDDGGRGPSGRCVDFVCDKLGTYGCDTQSELAEVATICSTQFNESCMASSCRRLGTYGCDTLSEIREVSGLCENVRSTGCIDVVCNRLGTYGCDSTSELKGVTEVCSGIRDTGCIDKMCERLGTYGCDTLSEVESVAKICKGR